MLQINLPTQVSTMVMCANTEGYLQCWVVPDSLIFTFQKGAVCLLVFVS